MILLICFLRLYDVKTGNCKEKFSTKTILADCVAKQTLIDSEEDCRAAAEDYYRATYVVSTRPDLTTPIGCSRRDSDNRIVWRSSDLVWLDTETFPEGYDKQWAIDQNLKLVCKTTRDFREYCTRFFDCESCFD